MNKEKKTVLLVDDVRLFLKLEETFFKRAGCQVVTAESGKEAIEQAKKHQPDAILLDYYMPDMKGDEICKILRQEESTKNIPVIIVSTSSKPEDIEKCYQAGCNDYLTKPIKPEVVLSRTAQVIGLPYRIHRRLAVNFRIQGRVPSLTFTGFSRNISESGILIETDRKINIKDSLQLWLPILENQDTIEVKGEVVREEINRKKASYCYGIKFIDLSPEEKEALSEFLKKHLPDEEAIE